MSRLITVGGLAAAMAWLSASDVAAEWYIPWARTSNVYVRQTWASIGDPLGQTATDFHDYHAFGRYIAGVSIGPVRADQESLLLLDGVRAEFQVTAPPQSTEFGSTAAESRFLLDLQLAYLSRVTVDGTVELATLPESPFPAMSNAEVSLTGPAAEWSYDAQRDGPQMGITAVAAPGRYTLTMAAVARGGRMDGSEATLNASLRLEIIGDFHTNGNLDGQDIDLLSAVVRAGTSDQNYFLNQDATVDQEDRRVWVHQLKHTWFGDADLNGEFSSADFVHVFAAGKYETDQGAGWSEGDWDGDDRFESGDFVMAFVDGGYEQGARANAVTVPEPTSIVPLTGGLIVWLQRRRTQRIPK